MGLARMQAVRQGVNAEFSGSETSFLVSLRLFFLSGCSGEVCWRVPDAPVCSLRGAVFGIGDFRSGAQIAPTGGATELPFRESRHPDRGRVASLKRATPLSVAESESYALRLSQPLWVQFGRIFAHGIIGPTSADVGKHRCHPGGNVPGG